jgi:hypothetical protein
MKYMLTICLVWGSVCYSQCINVFGKKINCPDAEDSLFIYNNAIKVNTFFENNKLYVKTRSRVLKSNYDKKDIYITLQHARSMFFVVRRDSSLKNRSDPNYIQPFEKYSDITYTQYYQEIDEYRFYQRELENQIINAESPMPAYDNRICPFVVNEYKCVDSSSIYFGDIVNIPMYIPVIIKPFSMLTSSEIVLRQKILNRENRNKYDTVKTENNSVLNVSIGKVNESLQKKGLPVFMYNNYGSGSIIGFIFEREFTKLKPEEYEKYVVLGFARELLGDDEMLEKWIKIRYGEYFIDFK